MRTIETTTTITAEGTLTVQVPSDIPPGPHHVVVLIYYQPDLPEARRLHDFPVLHVGAWPADSPCAARICMATRDAEPGFVDTNVLVYAQSPKRPGIGRPRTSADHEAAGAPLWVSRQVRANTW